MGNQDSFDVLVIGGGPAGMAAAVCAAEGSERVGIVDDNPDFGGQIWRGQPENEDSSERDKWTQRFRAANIARLSGLRVFQQPAPGTLLAETKDDPCELRYDKLILATGARERFLPFPGWTLPNVMGAGGLQAMVKSGLPIKGKRVVIAGTGPLLLAVGAYLLKHGAVVAMICEQASWIKLAGFALRLLPYRDKISQGLQLRKELSGIPFAANSWVVAARGEGSLASVDISYSGKLKTVPCDYLACGFHLVPSTELPQLLGCVLSNGYVQVDEFQRTTVENIFCAGEPTGIGGIEQALIEGQIAGWASIGRTEDARKLFSERQNAHRFAKLLDQTFELRPQLKRLANDPTLVCRCEDVPYSRLRDHASWRSAKLHTRCGMGACQGRICGAATEFLFGWTQDSVRPPVFPARVESIASATASSFTSKPGEPS